MPVVAVCCGQIAPSMRVKSNIRGKHHLSFYGLSRPYRRRVLANTR